MLNQKDNDFDDLFRRASDKYPLRTDSADWDRMSAALDNPPFDIPEEVVDVDRRRKRRFLWLFLLFPLVGGGYYLAQRGGGQTKVSAGQEVTAKKGVEEKAATAGVEEKGATAGGAEEKGTTTGVEEKATTGGTGVEAKQATAGVGEKVVTAGAPKGTTVRAAGAGESDVKGGARLGEKGSRMEENRGQLANINKSGSRSGRNGKTGSGVENGLDAVTVLGSKRGRGVKKGSSVTGVSGGGVGEISGEENFDAAKMTLSNSITNNNGNSVNGSGGSAAGRVANYPVNRVRMNGDYRLTVNVQAPVVAKDSSKTTVKASSKKKSSYLYAGLIAAPDFSTVKFQKMDGVGTTFGVLLGYQFSQRWAVESGVYMDRKKYYTDAEYFDMKNIYTRPNWDPKSFDGTCYMWEIPINVRYNFSLNEKNRWFATAGLSTYLMTREKYNYSFTWTSPTATGPGAVPLTLSTPSQYWFSIINLSVGYEHRLGGIGNLRIEPYLRIPVAGLGTGKLNILSSGINIGITRRLW